MDKIKQNKNYCTVDNVYSRRNSRLWFENGKCILAWALVLLLVLTFFPSLAVSADLTDNGILVSDGSDSSVALFTPSTGTASYSQYFGRSSATVYCVLERSSSTSSSAHTRFFSETPGATVITWRFNSGSDVENTVTTITLSSTPDSNNLYSNVGVGYNLNYFPSSTVYFLQSDASDAVRDYIDNGGGSTEQLHEVSFSLPQGNIAYVDVSGNSGNSSEAYLSLYKTMSFWHDRGYTSQSEYVGYADSIPSSIDVTTGQFSGLSQFHWSGVPDYNIFGQAKNYQYLAGLNSSAHYLVIYNAVGNSATAGGDTLSVKVTQARSVRVIPLTTDYSNGSYSATGSNSDGIDYTYDDDSGTWSWSTGGTPSVGPSEGGKTVIDSGQLTINEWLQKIANDIGDFFSGAIGAVTTLIGYASDFIHSISGLYSWLPGPVYSVLISALIIAITIGVIKVFI